MWYLSRKYGTQDTIPNLLLSHSTDSNLMSIYEHQPVYLITDPISEGKHDVGVDKALLTTG